MKNSYFHARADETMLFIQDALEAADAAGMLEAEAEGGTLAIELPAGAQFLLSKHAASGQLWLASPLSGGLHFSFDDASAEWKLADGRTLHGVLSAELSQLCSVAITL